MNERATQQATGGSVNLEAMVPFFEASLDGIVVVDRNRRYIYVNPAAEAIFGESAEELRGQDFLRTFPERMHANILAYFGKTISGTPGLWEITIVRPDGEERDVQFSNLEFDLDGERVISAIIRDLTDERWRTRETRAAAQVAAAFTLDRPLSEALDELCHIVVESGTAVACSAMLPVKNGPLTTVGSAGHLPGYQVAMAIAWVAGPPSFTRPFFRISSPNFWRTHERC
jgi:PAS domain S-box-containing protein